MISHLADGSLEFAYFRPGASTVTVAGDFNDWQPHTHEMTKDESGWWRIRMALPPGEYRFKYVVDKTLWEADFAAYGVEMCKTGGWNSVLWVNHQTPSANQVAAA